VKQRSLSFQMTAAAQTGNGVLFLAAAGALVLI
jgi:hypothetical protein